MYRIEYKDEFVGGDWSPHYSTKHYVLACLSFAKTLLTSKTAAQYRLRHGEGVLFTGRKIKYPRRRR